jgi:glycine cleavage system regulatory protein
VIGPDRPGLVDAMAGLVDENGGNWLESRLVRLGGQFAGVVRIQVPAERELALTESLKGLERRGLRTVVHSEHRAVAEAGRATAVLDVVGQDRPGIVHQISHVLALHGVNVEALDTECRSAAMSGEALFKARARLNIPAGCDPAALRRELEQIAEDLIVDVTLKELTEVAPAEL